MNYFYNRDRNITGANVLTGLIFNPSYGSNVSFSTKSNSIAYSDKILNIIPLGINNISADFSLNFPLRKSDAKDLVNFYESQSGTGVIVFNDNSNIYQPLSGTIDSLQSLESQNNDKFNVNLKFSVERNSSALNWSGQSFVDYQLNDWNTGINYTVNDIVYFENDLEEPVNNFYYCLSDHLSSISNNPLSTGQKWTNGLFSDSNDQFSFQQTPSVSQNNYKGSFLERVNDQKNVHSLEKLEISFKNISDKKTKSLLHFFESKLGFKRFSYSLPEIYDRPKIFLAPSWEHQWNSKDSNNFKAILTEDPFGLLPSGNPSASFIQESGFSQVNLSFTGERIFFNTGNGKELLSGNNATLTWPNNLFKREFSLYGRFYSLNLSGQGLTYAKFGSAKGLSYLNLDGNFLSGISINDCKDLQTLKCSNNRLSNLDLGKQPNLSCLDCSNNGINYLNIGGTILTGLYSQNNSLSSLHVDSCLSGLVSNNLYSGTASFSGNSSISQSSLKSISTLTGKSWTIDYEYVPPPAETPDNIPSASPSWPAAFEFFVAVDSTHAGACSLIENVPCYANATFETSTRFNFPNENDIAEYAIGQEFYIENQNKTMKVVKICCDIAAYVSGPTFCNFSPSPSFVLSTSPSNASNTLPSNPSFSATMGGTMGTISL